MVNFRKIKSSKLTIILLAFMICLSTLFFIPLNNDSVFASTENSSSGQSTIKENPSDDNFSIEKGFNDIYTGDETGNTMSISLIANKSDLVKPKGTTKSCEINCTWLWCGRHKDSAVFTNAYLKFSIYKYNGTQTTQKLVDYTLFCNKNGKWSESSAYFLESAKPLNVRVKGLLNNGTNPFIENEDLNFELELLLSALNQGDNYKVEFSYDYFYYKENKRVGKPFAWHDHFYRTHIKCNQLLSSETGTVYDIFINNIRKKYSDNYFLKKAYGENLANNLIALELAHSMKNIRVSFLVPIETDFNKQVPFAYKKTVDINVPCLSGRISTNEVVKALKEQNYISEEYEKTLLKCFNSNVLVGDKLDETLNNSSHKTEYMFSYYSTYIIHLKSSSGNSDNITLGLKSMSDYYSVFCSGSGKPYAVLDSNFYYAVFNNILNLYGLSGFKIPDGVKKGNVLTPDELYGYWGFSLIPFGSGFDGLLSKFFDSRKNSNGLCIPFSSSCVLTSTALKRLQFDFGYSWISRIFGDVVNSVNSSANATYYMFYVSELSNDFVYVVSENGSLEQKDTTSLTDKAIKNTVDTAVKGFKKISAKFLSFFDNKVFLYVVFGVLGFAGVMLVLKLFLKKDK